MQSTPSSDADPRPDLPVAIREVPAPAPLGLSRRRQAERSFTVVEAPIPGTGSRPTEQELLAAAVALVHRYTDETNVLIALPGADPDRVAVARVAVEADMSWGDLLAATESAVRAGRGQTVSVDLLIGERSSHDRTAPATHLALVGDGSTDAARRFADIVLRVTEDDAYLALNDRLYSGDDVARIGGHLGVLAVAGRLAEGTVTEPQLLSAFELDTVLRTWNDTSRATPEAQVHEMVAEVARAHPDRTAVEEPGHNLTYRELVNRVTALRHRLADLGCKPGAGVALLLERSADSLAVQLAAFGLGAPVVLIDPEYPADRVRFMISDSAAVAVATRRQYQGLVDEKSVPVVELTPGMPVPPTASGVAATPVAARCADPDDVCHVAYTSGSTGTPKAVQLRYGPMRQLTHTLVRECGIDGGSRGSWLSSPGLGMVEVDALPVLAAGGTLVIPQEHLAADPEALRDWIVENGITHSLMITSIAERIWNLPWPEGTPLRHLRIAGERCRSWPDPELPFTVLNVYGSSEATVVSLADLTAGACEHSAKGDLAYLEPPVGTPVDNVRLYVLDDADRPVPPGVTGHLHISGESLSRGYLDRPRVDTSAFRENPIEGDPYPVLYRSGDLARFWPDGTLEVVGRTDDQVKVRGHRVTLGEIEAVLLAHPQVRQVAVLPVRTDAGDTSLVAYVEPVPDTAPAHSALRRHVAERLPSPMVPARFLVGALPQSANGKIDRQQLTSPDRHRPALETPFRPAETDLERLMAQVWEELLEIDGLGVLDDFFELGGDSLRAIRMITRLSDEHDLTLAMEDLQAGPTVRAAAGRVRPRDAEDPPLPTAVAHPGQDGEPFALNESQQSLWIGRGGAVDLGDVGCHGYFEWDNDDLDVDRFRAAWVRLVQRHDMLRAVIRPDGTQVVLPEVPADQIPVDDLRSLSEDKSRDAIDQLRARMSHQVLDTATWPLYEVRISRLPDGHSRIHLGLDMLIVDAWSLYQTLIPDLIELYERSDVELPALGIGFRDYVLARQELRELPQYQRARRYWLDRLLTLPTAPALPTVSRRDSELRFERYEIDVDPQSWTTLQTSARERRVTPSGLVVSAFAEVLRAWSANDTFTINFPVSDRLPLHPQVDRLVGDFTNTLLVAVEKADGTFSERARSIQQQIWRDLEHRHFTGVEVLRQIARAEAGPLRPAMPSVLTSLVGHPAHRSSGDLGREVYGVSQTPQVLLDVQLREIDGTLHVKWDHLPAAFPAGLIGSMFEAFTTLLERLVREPEAWQAERFDLRPQAQRSVRDRVNATAVPVSDVTLPQMFAEQVRRRPDEPALISSGRTVSWGQLGAGASALAGRLVAAADPGPGRLVAVALPKGWQQYVAVHAVQVTGAGYLPLDVTQPDTRLTSLMERGEVAGIVTTADLSERFGALTRVPVLTVDPADLDGPAQPPALDPAPGRAARPDDVAYVIYTSGSTGEPMGVTIDHRAAVNHVLDATSRFGLTAEDRHLATAGLHFDMSVFDVFGPLAHGGAVVMPDPAPGPDPDQWMRLAARHAVTFWAAVPALMEMVCELHEHSEAGPLAALRRVVLAGDWIPLGLPDRIRRMAPGVRVASCGGPTETTNWSICHEIGEVDPSWASIPYGVPMANSKYHIVSPQLRHQPDWVAGEMVVESTVSLAKGYWGAEEITAERFVSDPDTAARWYRTGDLGRYLPDGNIEILGRDDFQVKIHGHRIELGEIDHVLTSCEGVEAAATVATPRDAGPTRLVAFAVAPSLSTPELVAHLHERLPGYMVPRDIRLVDSLPLTDNVKIDRRKLMAEAVKPAAGGAASGAAGDGDGDGAMDALTEVVTAGCAVILNVPEVVASANFFAAGGDSLSAMKLSILLSETLGVDVPLGSILQAAVLGDVADVLRADPQAGPIVVRAADALRAIDEEEAFAS